MLSCGCGTSAETLWEAEAQSLSGCLSSRFSSFRSLTLNYWRDFRGELTLLFRFLFHIFLLQNCKVGDAHGKVKFCSSSWVRFCLFCNRKSSLWPQTCRKLWIDHPADSGGRGPQTPEPALDTGRCTYHAPIDLSPLLPTDCKQRRCTEMRAKRLHSLFFFFHAPFVTYKIKRCQTTRIM